MDKRKKIFCIVGESCSGKDSLVRKLIDYDKETFRTVKSYTNRPMRDGEKDGEEHYFLNDEDFEKKLCEEKSNIAAYTKISSKENIQGYEYFATLDEVMNSSIYIIDPKGIEYLKEKLYEKMDIIVVYIYCPPEMRKLRAERRRSDFHTEYEKRVNAERSEFDHFYRHKKYDYIVYNYDTHQDEALATLLNIMYYEIKMRSTKSEYTTILGEEYKKSDLMEASSFLKTITEFYKSQISDTDVFYKKADEYYKLIRNILLSHLR